MLNSEPRYAASAKAIFVIGALSQLLTIALLELQRRI
jgi:hypothetical protein